MDNNEKTYRMPADFDPCRTANALRGLTAAIQKMVMEGSFSESSLSDEEYFSLCGLVILMYEQARALHDYLGEIENLTTIRLPRSEADFENLSMARKRKRKDGGGVKEPAVVYASRR